MSWLESLRTIEELEDAPLDAELIGDLQRRGVGRATTPIRFSTPTFKDYASTELQGCSKNSFPAFSIASSAPTTAASLSRRSSIPPAASLPGMTRQPAP